MALVAPIIGSMVELGKFAGGAVDGLGKVVGESIEDIRSAVNSFLGGTQISNTLKDFDPIEDIGKFVGESIEDINSTVNSLMKGPQISNALKDFGSNSESFFKDAMTTILTGVNAVADVISSDAEGSPKADKLVPQWDEPKYKRSEEKGKDVVKEAVSVVTRLKLGSEEFGILERIAQHESLNGEHSGTFSNKNGKAYHGGIFQVDEKGFKDTQNISSHPGLKKKFDKIKKELGIDWTTVKWEDLRKPLYSALAARLLLTLAYDPKTKTSPPIPKDKKGQADYWKKYYNKSGKGTPKKFLDSNPDLTKDN